MELATRDPISELPKVTCRGGSGLLESESKPSSGSLDERKTRNAGDIRFWPRLGRDSREVYAECSWPTSIGNAILVLFCEVLVRIPESHNSSVGHDQGLVNGGVCFRQFLRTTCAVPVGHERSQDLPPHGPYAYRA